MSEREEAIEVLRSVIASDPYHQQFTPLVEAYDDLRQCLATAERERDEARRERDDALIDRRFSDEQRAKWMAENVALLHRAERAERILDALREPSEVVMIAVQDAVYDQVGAPCHYREATVIVRAAVAAAEREGQP